MARRSGMPCIEAQCLYHRSPVSIISKCAPKEVEDDHHGQGNHDQRYRVTEPGLRA